MCSSFFLFHSSLSNLVLHSFPTRRSSDLRSFHILNAVSPGFTCAFPFSRYVVNKIIEKQTTKSETINEEVSRSEEHTSELQSRGHLVCRLLLEKKKQLSTTLYK